MRRLAPPTTFMGGIALAILAGPNHRQLSVIGAQAAINRYVAEHNDRPTPAVRKADPASVIAAINRGKQASESIH